MKSGIYVIEDSLTGVCLYVGQSRDLETRKRKHIEKLKNGSHPRKDFIEWFKESGENRLKVTVVEEGLTSDEELNSSEIWWFNKLRPVFYGKEPSLNETWVHSQATKDKIRQSLTGRVRGSVEKRPESRNCDRCGTSYKFTKSKSLHCSNRCSKLTHAKLGYPVNKEVLEELYLDSKLSLRAIGDLYGVSQVAVLNLCKKYEIPRRTK